MAGLFFIYGQVRHARKTLETQAHFLIYQKEADIQYKLIEHPSIKEFLFHKISVPSDRDTRERLMTFCSLYADFFECLLLEKDNIDSRILKGYSSFALYVFANSPAYELFFSYNRDNYSKDLLALYAKANATPKQQASN